ncbi:MAG TPA: YfaZ family outer membrane protein [Nevskiaceae bacterium]|nr:YfaZ family outer membrane protein [Nevskiaceae bacterium]
MKRVLAILGIAIGAVALPAQAEIVDFNIGDNAFRLDLAGPLSRLFSGVSGQYDIGALLKPRTSDNLIQVHTGVLLTGDVGAKGIDLAAGLGGRIVYTGRNHDSGGAFAPGVQLEARLPEFNRFGTTFYGYFGPSVTSFGEVRKYQEYGLDLDYAVIKGGSVYVGWRSIKEDFEDQNSYTVDRGIHGGFRLKF